MNHVYETFSRLLDDFNLPFMQPRDLEIYCRKIHDKGAALGNCFGFVDGTVRPISRPGVDQRLVYNGHKKVHALKFQSIALPTRIIGHLCGPIEGRRLDCYLLQKSNLLTDLTQFAFNANGDPLRS